MSPIAARNAAVATRFTPGTVISRLASGECSICLAISRSTSAISRVQERDLPERRLHGLGLLDRQLQRAKPLAALDPEQIRARRLALQPAHQDRVHLVLDARARADQLLAAREPAAQHATALVGHPHRVQLALPQQLRQRPRVEPVGLRTRLRDPGVIRRDHDHLLHVRLEQPRDLPRATGDLQRHPVGRLQTRRERLERLRRRRSPGRRSGPRRPRRSRSHRNRDAGQDRSRGRPTSPPCDTCCTTITSTHSNEENQRANDNDRYVLSAQSGQVAGAAKKKSPRSKRIVQNGLPDCVLPEGPCPGSPDRTLGAGRSLEPDFHATTPKSLALPRVASHACPRRSTRQPSGRPHAWTSSTAQARGPSAQAAPSGGRQLSSARAFRCSSTEACGVSHRDARRRAYGTSVFREDHDSGSGAWRLGYQVKVLSDFATEAIGAMPNTTNTSAGCEPPIRPPFATGRVPGRTGVFMSGPFRRGGTIPRFLSPPPTPRWQSPT